MPDWTAAQQRAIHSDSNHIVCSAAAGSGKTAVMVERIIRFLRTGAEPDSFLIVTFTNASAAEMKEKIRKRLYEESGDPFIRNALDQIDLMQISTIHSFCQQLIKNHFQIVDIDPDFQICDTSQKQKLFHEAFEEACDILKKDNSSAFDILKTRYEIKNAEKIIEKLDNFLFSLPDPFEWMNRNINHIPENMEPDHPWFHSVREMAKDEWHAAELLLSQMYRMLSDNFCVVNYQDSWKKDAELFHVKQTEIEDGKVTKSTFSRVPVARGLTIQESDWKDRYQELRKKWKEHIMRIDDLMMADPEKSVMEWKNTKETLQSLQKLITETENEFQKRKKARSLVDFSDLEQYAVQILTNPAGREESHQTWRYLFIDECQDISAVQNRIIDLLQNDENHLFMVGDIKQSIYRFRLADPMIFLNRIKKAASGEIKNGEYISLQSNFRSRPEILDTTNRVFRSVMRESAAEIEYGPSEELLPGRKTEGEDPVQVVMIDKGEKNLSDLEATADFLKNEIKTLRQTRYFEDGRNYTYRDCVILMPAVQTDGPILAELLEKREIPVFFDGNGDYYQRREIQMIRNLLEWIDDPLQDIPLLSVLMESPFQWSEENLSQIRLRYPEKDMPYYQAFTRVAEEESPLGKACAEVLKKLAEWQRMAESMRVSELIWELYQDTGIYYLLGAEDGGDVKQANLRMLVRQASQGENAGIVTLRKFLSYMKDQMSFGDQQSATLLGEQDDLVRIMTIHKSKGLQFPVVFCAGMDKAAARGESGEILFHSELGLTVNYKDPVHRISRPTLATEIFNWKRKREEKAEKIRLLYVAMTRAQEKLYLLTCQQTNPLWSMPEGDARILAASSYTDWWMPALRQKKNEKLSTGYAQPENPYEIRTFECNQQKSVEKENNIHNLESWLETVISAPVVDELWKKTEKETKSETMVKRSVTSLIRSAKESLAGEEEDLEEETPEKKRIPDLLARRLNRDEMEEMPSFLRTGEKMTGAWRGTITHRILSVMSLEKMREGQAPEEALQEEKKRMLRENMATEAELRQIRDRQIVSFWRQKIGKRILSSPEVHREWNFNLLIHREQDMILQGVIDCAFREGEEWVILDYKTDRNKNEDQLAEEYVSQVRWYARAVEELTGQKVKEMGLYSLELGKFISL